MNTTHSQIPKFPLKEVEEPQLFREIFPYTEVPRNIFDGVIVPMELPKEFWITDTTFRDGQQARPPYTEDQIVEIYDLLHKLSGPKGIIRQSEFFLYSKKDKKAVEKCLERGYKYPEVTGWIRANVSDFELVKQMGLKETGILTSISDYHIFLKLKKNRKQAIDDYMKIVETAAEAGLKAIRCHFEDITRADFWGCVLPFAERLMRFSEESGLYIKIRLCDTMGFGLPWAEASLPRSVPKLIYYLRKELGIPSERLEWHGHNDFHKVHTNSVAAWLYGCAAVNSVLFGHGERTGNSPLEALCIEYVCLRGTTDGMDLSVITDIAEYYQKKLGIHIPSNYPFVGANFNVTSAGIHADGILKDIEIYNIFDTEKILKRPPSVHITDKSGQAGIAFWINSYLGLKGEKRIEKTHPGIDKIYKWVMEQYEAGRVTAISHEELLEQAKIHLPEYFK